MTLGPPSYWLRQRAGDVETVRLNATEAELIAQRPGAVGDYMSEAGLVWREPNPDSIGSWDRWNHFTITPVWEQTDHPQGGNAPPPSRVAHGSARPASGMGPTNA